MKGAVIVLEKNPHYFKPGLPYLDRVELRVMKDGITRVTALGGYGVDRQAIVKTALLGVGQPVWSVVPHGAKDDIDFGEHYPYDPDKARALLKEAGYDEKNPLKYRIASWHMLLKPPCQPSPSS